MNNIFVEHFGKLEDKDIKNKQHLLIDIIEVLLRLNTQIILLKRKISLIILILKEMGDIFIYLQLKMKKIGFPMKLKELLVMAQDTSMICFLLEFAKTLA